MPMFYTPKPRQFTYRPRFYDPEKERWEALKQKYADEKAAEAEGGSPTPDDDRELEYFQRRVRQIDREERQKSGGLTWKDAFRKRDMPKFNYQPRFSGQQAAADGEATEEHAAQAPRKIKIKRRFDLHPEDSDGPKPIPATRILLYTFLACLLIYWIVF